VQCSAVQCSAVQCSAVQCSAVQCSAVQCSAVQCSAVQCSAVQCSAVPSVGIQKDSYRDGAAVAKGNHSYQEVTICNSCVRKVLHDCT
jgi:hypothetical protein